MREYGLWLAKTVTLLLIFVVGIPLLFAVMAGVGAALKEGKSIVSSNKVAVVELTGVIEGARGVTEKLQDAVDDSSIKAIVLRIDSPGGGVGASQEIFAGVKRFAAQKPIVVSMGTAAASGGLYAAIGASKIYALPGTITGSIGVIMQLPNFGRAAQWLGFDMVTIKSGALKDTGNSFRPMTDAERQFLETTTASIHAQFIKDVATARKLPVEKVRSFADGRVIMGDDALKLGLIDGIGDVYDAGREALNLAGVKLKDNDQPSLVYSEDKLGTLRRIIEGISNLVPSATTGLVAQQAPRLMYVMSVFQ